jgi:hypothetical protein
MREALHILRKDVRALWPQILIVLAACAFCVLYRDEQHADQVTVMLTLARWFLIVCLIHQEKLVGDREWWLTRPHSWKALLTAKLLFIAIFVQFPLLCADLAILFSNGLPLAPAWEHLAFRQACLALALVVPAAALAAVTEGLVSFALAALAIFIAIFLPVAKDIDVARWGPMGWVPPAVMFVLLSLVAMGILLWQYSRRRPLPARSALGGATVVCSALLIVPPIGAGVGIATHSLRPPPETDAIRIEENRQEPPSTSPNKSNGYILTLPVHIAGMPAGMRAQPEMFDLSIDAPDGTRWNSGWRTFSYALWARWNWKGPNDATVSTIVERSVFDRLRKQRAAWRISLVLTVYGRERTQLVSASDGAFHIEGLGVCVSGREMPYGHILTCRKSAPDAIGVEDLSLYPADWAELISLGPSPIWTSTVLAPHESNGGPVTFHLRRPVAHIRRDFTEQIRLEDYQ